MNCWIARTLLAFVGLSVLDAVRAETDFRYVADQMSRGSFEVLRPQIAANDLTYDPKEAQKAAIFDQFISDARSCMYDAVRTMLIQGSRDSKQIVAFATTICGVGLKNYMVKSMGRPEAETTAFIQAMAYKELNRVPGVERPAGKP